MTTPPRHSMPDTRPLWFGVLANPIAWALHLLISYAVAEVNCQQPSPTLMVFGVNGSAILITLITVAAELLVLYAGRVAYRNWKATRHVAGGIHIDAGDAGGAGYHAFLALVGLFLSGIFFVAILFAGLPALVVRHCV